ncbi:hypothetical protein BBBOND_0204350 [Babesia bigemina]|uniref:Uncharacterized protein n=1 Tax=Babesia bigemina TaxID=5866 RepID=A0A061D5H1_BABBI|nr:hypothetical protein BBBOND_0204350 [Babesia bigemina]CDR95277.1 hypothetical protein BBBOND_0204350 [Babesia bigemina]|eukprot:XP_012767463.1 hypothetical protein BBBOND_0204350 [Babesia bigemina]
MASGNNSVVYLAVIGEQRELIVSRAFGDADEAQLQLSAYAAMDVIQEKMVIQHYSATPGEQSDPYLGFITPTLLGEEFYKVHAYMAATGFTIIAIFDEHDASLESIRQVLQSLNSRIAAQFFEKIHILFANTMCNPFMSMKFHSPRFYASLEKIASEFATPH